MVPLEAGEILYLSFNVRHDTTSGNRIVKFVHDSSQQDFQASQRDADKGAIGRPPSLTERERFVVFSHSKLTKGMFFFE
jgi:hypothetical protein